MSHKCTSTKGSKRNKKLLARQNFYDHVLDKIGGYHRPGGDGVNMESFKVWFDKDKGSKAVIDRLVQLGFDGVNSGKKLITLTGKMSLGICTLTDFLVNHFGFKYTKVEEESNG